MERYLMCWVGGKRLLRKTIAPLIPQKLTTYVEPFGGGAWILLYKDRWATSEIYNDTNGNLVNLFKIVKYHPQALKDELKWRVKSRQLFYEMRDFNFTGMTDIQRAAQFLMIVVFSFGGQVSVNDTPAFGVKRKAPAESIDRLLQRIEMVYKRLDGVTIENLDFEHCIKLYDSPEAFFYCDPPYLIREESRHYQGKFDHERLVKVLKKIKGRFLLSYNNSPEIQKLYKSFNVKEISRQRGLNLKQGFINYKELLISNYDWGKIECQ